MKTPFALIPVLLLLAACASEPQNPDAPWAHYEPPKEDPLSDPFRHYKEWEEAEPTDDEASTEGEEEEGGSFFTPTEKIPADVSVDYPVDI